MLETPCLTTPTSRSVSAEGRVRAGLRHARPIVQAVYRGPYEGLGAAWAEFDAFAQQNGVPTPGVCDLWEVYLRGPETGPDGSADETQLNRARR